MAKTKTLFTCQECGYQVAKWMGKCSECGQWNSFLEETAATKKTHSSERSSIQVPKLLQDIKEETHARIETGIREFDRALGGGIVPGSLILVGGEPGIGKSTLLLQISQKLSHHRVLYVSGEESESQIASRAKRLGMQAEQFYILHETNWQNVLNQIKILRPTYLVLDSIQTVISDEIQSPPGTVSQIKEVTYQVMNYSKAFGMTSFIIGHVTKEGAIAGPKILEHMVDTVIYFEGDNFGHYRILRVIKNRFGNTNEVGIFEMSDNGLQEVSNPSQFFIESSLESTYGRSISCIIEGTRSLFVEIQALVVENKYGNGRRTTQGIDTNRLAMLVAVIEKYFGIPLSFNDVYINVVGGVKLYTRETDLSILASLLSSLRKAPLDERTICMGEVGLTGEVRNVPLIELRLKEMAQMGYQKVITNEKIAKEYQHKFPLEFIGIKRATELEGALF